MRFSSFYTIGEEPINASVKYFVSSSLQDQICQKYYCDTTSFIFVSLRGLIEPPSQTFQRFFSWHNSKLLTINIVFSEETVKLICIFCPGKFAIINIIIRWHIRREVINSALSSNFVPRASGNFSRN